MAIAINAKVPSQCMTCSDRISVGELIWWEKGIGAWHINCKQPANIKVYRKEKEDKERLYGKDSF